MAHVLREEVSTAIAPAYVLAVGSRLHLLSQRPARHGTRIESTRERQHRSCRNGTASPVRIRMARMKPTVKTSVTNLTCVSVEEDIADACKGC